MVTIQEFESKGQWRGWVWRLLRTTARGPILYLPGEDNLDLAVAEAFGVDTKKLIAIDRAESAIQNARAEQTVAIHGELQDVLAAWPDDWEISGLSADLYSCLAGDAIDLLPAIRCPPLKRRVIVNLQRGRENAGGVWPEVGRAMGTRHRGVAWLWLRCQLEEFDTGRGGYGCWYDDRDKRIGAMVESCRPQYATYRSRAVTMDSVAFWVPPWFGGRHREHDVLPAVRRRIAAARAVMTRRNQTKESAA